MKDESVFIYSPELLNYKFSQHHPFNQIRLKAYTRSIKKHWGYSENQIIPPRSATKEELQLIHDPDYIQAVSLAGHGYFLRTWQKIMDLGTEDTPIFTNMHEASSLLVGGP